MTIFPKIKAAIPAATLTIAGANATPEIKTLGALEGVNFEGFIAEEDLPSLYENAFLSVSPLLAGAGIKGKICEAIAYRTPVLTNDIGNEGINLVHEEEGLIGTIVDMPRMIIKALKREHNFDHITEKAQHKLVGIVGSAIVQRNMLNSIFPMVSICIVTWNRLDLSLIHISEPTRPY